MATKIIPSSSSISRFLPISRATFASSSRSPLPLRPLRSISTFSSSSFSAPRSRRQLPRSSFSVAKRYASAAAVATPAPSADIHPVPRRTSVRVIPPSLEEIKEEGYLDEDVQLLPSEEAFLNITPDALQQLVNITSREPPELLEQGKLALRVGVESGGCHGYQYTMALTEERGVDDYVLQPEGVSSIPVVVDLVSFGLLKGATIHFATELIGSSFRIQDNPQAKQGGSCGCGVSWEAA